MSAKDKIAIELLKRFQTALIAKDKKVSGRTYDSLRTEITENEVLLYGASYFENVEFGRGATKSNSNTGFLQRLREWIELRGIDKKALYPIYKTIQRKGTLLHRQNKQAGIFKEALKGFTPFVTRELAIEFTNITRATLGTSIERLKEQINI